MMTHTLGCQQAGACMHLADGTEPYACTSQPPPGPGASNRGSCGRRVLETLCSAVLHERAKEREVLEGRCSPYRVGGPGRARSQSRNRGSRAWSVSKQAGITSEQAMWHTQRVGGEARASGHTRMKQGHQGGHAHKRMGVSKQGKQANIMM